MHKFAKFEVSIIDSSKVFELWKFMMPTMMISTMTPITGNHDYNIYAEQDLFWAKNYSTVIYNMISLTEYCYTLLHCIKK